MSQERGTVVDLRGNPIVAGDRIAGAFRDSTTAFLRLGTVLGFGERGNALTIKVRWDTESGRSAQTIDVIGAIEADLFRFVKLDV